MTFYYAKLQFTITNDILLRQTFGIELMQMSKINAHLKYLKYENFQNDCK